jgi:hypothetical protein
MSDLTDGPPVREVLAALLRLNDAGRGGDALWIDRPMGPGEDATLYAGQNEDDEPVASLPVN